MFRMLVVLLWCLMGMAMAVPLDDQKQQTDLVSAASPRTLTGAAVELAGQILVAVGILALLVVGVGVLLYEVISGLASGKKPEEELVPEYYSNPPQHSSYTSYQSRSAKDSIMTQVLNSIDPVDMSFRFMEIENSACRKRTLCELSAIPLIGQFVRYISPSINSLKDYQDAMTAGEALQDCALLFAECPENQHFTRK